MKNSEKYWESTCECLSVETRTILNEYLLSLKLESKADATISKYREYLERFLRECSMPIDHLTSDDVKTWLNAFSKDKKIRTVDLVLSALSSFFQFCLEEEYMDVMVMKKRWKPKVPHSLPKYLNEEETVRLKRAAKSLTIRNRALILFLLSTGCRESEVVNVTIQDVNLDKRTAIVKRKGKKIRHVHFSEECSIVLNDYLCHRSWEEKEPLFRNKFGKALGKSGIYLIVRKVGKQTGFVPILHPHVLRHTFTRNMLARGATIQCIANEMGHSDLNTTRMYAQIPTEEMILTYQNIMG